MSMFRSDALTSLTLQDLERLLKAVYREQLPCPIDTKALHVAGLSYLMDKVDFLQGMPVESVRAVLVAVIAERRAGPGRS